MKTRIFLDMLAAVKNLATLQAGNFNAILKAYRSFLKDTPAEGKKVATDGGMGKPLTGMYDASVVWQYYVKGKKTFATLDMDYFSRQDKTNSIPVGVKGGETVT